MVSNFLNHISLHKVYIKCCKPWMASITIRKQAEEEEVMRRRRIFLPLLLSARRPVWAATSEHMCF